MRCCDLRASPSSTARHICHQCTITATTPPRHHIAQTYALGGAVALALRLLDAVAVGLHGLVTRGVDLLLHHGDLWGARGERHGQAYRQRSALQVHEANNRCHSTQSAARRGSGSQPADTARNKAHCAPMALPRRRRRTTAPRNKSTTRSMHSTYGLGWVCCGKLCFLWSPIRRRQSNIANLGWRQQRREANFVFNFSQFSLKHHHYVLFPLIITASPPRSRMILCRQMLCAGFGTRTQQLPAPQHRYPRYHARFVAPDWSLHLVASNALGFVSHRALKPRVPRR